MAEACLYSDYAPASFPACNNLGTDRIEGWVGPKADIKGENVLHLLGFKPRIIQPIFIGLIYAAKVKVKVTP